MSYDQFLSTKLTRVMPDGFDIQKIPQGLFQFQRDIVRWACKRGRAAIFADTGLGKTRMQLAWADGVICATGKPLLIVAPLAVAEQTAKEGEIIGLSVKVCREQSDVHPWINVTNYERIHKFDASVFGGVVLDESSIIKHHDAATFKLLCDTFSNTDYKLACTATPSPNDYTELGTHAEFLGYCSRAEMLAEYFCHDGGETSVWRVKGHAKRAFWQFVASWGALVRKPSDLGYSDDGYNLPPLSVHHHISDADHSDANGEGMLFALPAMTLQERRRARSVSISDRVAQCAALVNSNDLPWVVWCDLNAESDALTKAIRGAVEVRGSQTIEEKESRLRSFASGESRVIVSKPSICGFGLNWQHCHNMAFVGVTDSWESYYQAVRRCYRFGQKSKVDVHIFTSELEGAVIANLERKERDAKRMADELSQETRGIVRDMIMGASRVRNTYNADKQIIIPEWVKEESYELVS